MSTTLAHRVSVKVSLGALALDAAFTLTAPWTVLFGPSGCGKTSILRAMSGTLPNAAVTFARDTTQSSWKEIASLAPDCRSLSYAPQSGALFPHLTVRQNVGFPYTVCREPGKQSTLVDEVLSLFSLYSLAERMPKDLSGGERQRVSLARAFAKPGACLLMLDEPFAGLDRDRRDELLPAMRQGCADRGIQVLSVTHDVDEALRVANDVIRLESGKVVAQGPARDVLAHERERMLVALG